MDVDSNESPNETYYCHTCEREVSYAAYIESEGAYQCVDCGDLFVEVRIKENNAPDANNRRSEPHQNPNNPQPNQQQNFAWSFSMNNGPQTYTWSNVGGHNNSGPPPFGAMFGNLGNMFGMQQQQQQQNNNNNNNNQQQQQNNGAVPHMFQDIFGMHFQAHDANRNARNRSNQNESNPNNTNPDNPDEDNQQPNQQNQQFRAVYGDLNAMLQDIFQPFGGPAGPNNNGDANENNNNNNNQNQQNQSPFVQLLRMPFFNFNQANMQGVNFGNINMGDYAWGPMTQIIANLVDPNHHGPPPASREEVEALPELEVTREMINDEHCITDCAVCKEEFSIQERCLKLPCGHLYHKDCIRPWLERHNTCPVCRFELRTDNEFYERLRAQRDAARQNDVNMTDASNPS